jgi:hypothetical protein
MDRDSRRARGVKYFAALTLPLVCLTAVTSLGPAGEVRPAEAVVPPEVDAFRELTLVDPRVVNPQLNGMRSHNGGPNTPLDPGAFAGSSRISRASTTESACPRSRWTRSSTSSRLLAQKLRARRQRARRHDEPRRYRAPGARFRQGGGGSARAPRRRFRRDGFGPWR